MRKTFAIGLVSFATLGSLWTFHAQSTSQSRASQQEQLRSTAPGGGVARDTTLPVWPAARNPLDAMTPVTDAMLANPPAGDWLTWRRTYDDLGFSPIRQITKDNVKNLRVAWSLTLPPGQNEATPLVHSGVIFVHSYNDNVQALDAATVDELWHYSRKLPEGVRASVKKNMALYSNKLFVGTSDLHVVALDAKTGNVIWDQAIANTADGWGLTGGATGGKRENYPGNRRSRSRRRL